MQITKLPKPFLENIIIQRNTTCWNWGGIKTPDGYGMYGKRRAHRFSYEWLIGKIPPGLVTDHLCRNRACVNPEHIEPVTIKENVLRGEGITAKQARQTACKRGHEFNLENTYYYMGRIKVCRICRRENVKAYKLRLKESRGSEVSDAK